MCGIAGVLPLKQSELGDIRHVVGSMCNHMRNRGPDAVGYWSDIKSNLTFGHRRLSILDLDPRSNQPMHSESGRYTIVFNGEIYNYLELREKLIQQGETFHTSGDTEVILKLFQNEQHQMLNKLRGMFAIAIWDQVEQSLFLARDPYGIKPLYYSKNQNQFIFASQVKAISASNCVSKDLSFEGQSGFWLFGSVPEPHTWYKEIVALPAGTWLKVQKTSNSSTKFQEPQVYRDVGDTWRDAPPCMLSKEEVQEVVRVSVLESVKKHLVSDVPVGVFLSGGIDSGSLAGLMKDCGVSGLHGVTIAFSEFEGSHEDEAPMAATIAKNYNFKHHIRYVTKAEFQKDLPRILSAMDQPSMDGINTWYASKAVAELGLKVVISGVGGDELFYGYPSFQQIPQLVQNANRLLKIPGLKTTTKLATQMWSMKTKNNRWKYFADLSNSIYGAYWLRRGLYAPNDLACLMSNSFKEETDHIRPDELVRKMVGAIPVDGTSAVGQMESMVYLRNQLLRDSDWASMDHSVELRTPLVDAWLLHDLQPVLRSFQKYQGKHLLARSPQLPLNAEAINKTKTGFGIPLGKWLEPEGSRSFSNKGGAIRHWAQIVSRGVYSHEGVDV